MAGIMEGLRLAIDLASATNRAADVSRLIETQQQVVEVLEENRELRNQVASLKDELEASSQLVREGLVYYLREDDGTLTGPICPSCYKRDRVVSGLTKMHMGGNKCYRCDEEYALGG